MTYDPNDIALLFSFTFPLVLSFFSTARLIGKLLSILILIGLVLGIVQTGSRGGMLAFGASLILIFFASKIGLQTLYKYLVLTMVIMFVISPKGQTLRDRFSSLFSGQDYNLTNTESAAGGRLAIWRSGFDLLTENILLGVGAGNSSTAMGQKHGDTGWRTMHNSYLQAGVEMGLLGLAIYLAMLRKVLSNCRSAINFLSHLPSTQRDDIRLLAFASGLRIGFASYLIAGFFLSQAFSVVVPISLAISSRLLFLARTAHSSHLPPTALAQ
jgi:O-antigen ligase